MLERNTPESKWRKVQAYKHDGELHRQWSPAFLVEETPEYWVLCSRASLVTESDGRKWMTKEKAVFVLFKKEWMNVIAMFKPDRGICYYVNIASPTIDDGGYLRYIDYDLDLKLYPDGVERTLDEKEYARHIGEYGYPDDLVKAISKAMARAKVKLENRQFPFSDEMMERLYNDFLAKTAPFSR